MAKKPKTTFQKNDPNWLTLIAPVAWLVCRILERLFGIKWRRDPAIPYPPPDPADEDLES